MSKNKHQKSVLRPEASQGAEPVVQQMVVSEYGAGSPAASAPPQKNVEDISTNRLDMIRLNCLSFAHTTIEGAPTVIKRAAQYERYVLEGHTEETSQSSN